VTIGDQGPGIDAVLPANAEGARAAALHLTGLGHREIGVIAGPRSLVTIADRSDGFRRGLMEGDGDARGYEVEGDFSRDAGYAATGRLLAEHPELTAVFAMNDVMAIGALAALRDAGRRVPADVSVVGFDDLPICADLVPALTTVRVDTEGMGEQAMRMVVAASEEREPDAGREVAQSPTELVVRGSTGPAPF
jgi:LacI family transcriptional regulator